IHVCGEQAFESTPRDGCVVRGPRPVEELFDRSKQVVTRLDRLDHAPPSCIRAHAVLPAALSSSFSTPVSASASFFDATSTSVVFLPRLIFTVIACRRALISSPV